MHWIYLLASGAEAAAATTSLSRSVLVAVAAAVKLEREEAVDEEGAGDKQDGQLFLYRIRGKFPSSDGCGAQRASWPKFLSGGVVRLGNFLVIPRN